VSTLLSPISLSDVKAKMELHGKVSRIELAGAFIDAGLADEAFLHISQIKGKKIKNVQDVLSVGQEITVWVQSVDLASQRVQLTMIKPALVELSEVSEGQVYTGHVVRLEKFGAFVDFGAERPGLVHVSEMDSEYVKSPEDVVTKGQEVQVKVIRVNRERGQIDLSMKSSVEVIHESAESEEEAPTAMAIALRKALDPEATPEVAGEGDPKGKRPDRSQVEAILRRTLELQQKE
jgi:ribosomal protein S1